ILAASSAAKNLSPTRSTKPAIAASESANEGDRELTTLSCAATASLSKAWASSPVPNVKAASARMKETMEWVSKGKIPAPVPSPLANKATLKELDVVPAVAPIL